MPDFRIGAWEFPLADVLGSDDDLRTKVHDDGHDEVVRISERHIALASSALGPDLVGDLINLDRYVRKGYEDDWDPLGDRLGHITEALTWMRFHRRGRGDDLVRVVGTGPAGLKRPDFIRREKDKSGTKIRLIEVKSTDALSLKRVDGDKAGNRTCARLKSTAKEALAQLGLDDTGARDASVVLRSLFLRHESAPVPFPGDSAMAVVWMPRDRRLERNGLSAVAGTESCSKHGRRCETCLGPGVAPRHLLEFVLPNAPGLVPLISAGEGSDAWFDAYADWARADWLDHPGALVDAANGLWESTTAWTRRWDGGDNRVIPWWRRHLTSRVARAGIRDLRSPWWDQTEAGWSAETGDALERYVVGDDVQPARPSLREGVTLATDQSWTLRYDSAQLDLRATVPHPITNTNEAQEAAIDLVSTLLLQQGVVPPSDFTLPVRPITFQGEVIGWELVSQQRPPRHTFLDQRVDWYLALWRGSHGAHLHILPDGRARLSMTLDESDEPDSSPFTQRRSSRTSP